jgi:hypothetical protein
VIGGREWTPRRPLCSIKLKTLGEGRRATLDLNSEATLYGEIADQGEFDEAGHGIFAGKDGFNMEAAQRSVLRQ